jgi:outer membrane lipoprotein-sorting protein
MPHIRRTALLLLSAGALGGTALGSTLEEVKQKVKDAIRNVKSLSCKMKSETQVETDQFKSKSISTGTMEWMRKDAKLLMRSEDEHESRQTLEGQETHEKFKSLSIYDGQYLYFLREQDGKKTATKSAYDLGAMWDDPWAAMAMTGMDVQIKLLPDESVDGADCYVVESHWEMGTPPHKSGATTKVYFQKSTGLAVKTLIRDLSDKPTGTVTLSDVKTNVEIDASRFVFKLPEGVQFSEDPAQPRSAAPAGDAEAPGSTPKESGSADQPPKPKADPPPPDQPKEDKPKDQKPKIPKPKLPGRP